VEIMRVHNGFGSSAAILTGTNVIDSPFRIFPLWWYIRLKNALNLIIILPTHFGYHTR
jgi:hypothetical protein